MATCFDRWEKDPFFPAAEEVQESADRMQSVYRRWIRERKVSSNPNNGNLEVLTELLQELRTALGTAKWQLDEFNRAVKSNEACSAGEERSTRHNQFVEVIGNQISTVEHSLKESNENGQAEQSWVSLDKDERDELALFLSRPFPLPDGLTSGGCRSDEKTKGDAKEEKVNQHRRATSACADIEAWKISVPNEDVSHNPPPPKIPSFSCLTNELELVSKVKLPKNVLRKWKAGDQHQQDDSEYIPLTNPQLSRGCNACYVKTKSCLSSCGHEAYDKQLYGWFGILQRQMQRSQYQIRNGRPFQMIFWAVLVVLLIVFLAFRVI